MTLQGQGTPMKKPGIIWDFEIWLQPDGTVFTEILPLLELIIELSSRSLGLYGLDKNYKNIGYIMEDQVKKTTLLVAIAVALLKMNYTSMWTVK